MTWCLHTLYQSLSRTTPLFRTRVDWVMRYCSPTPFIYTFGDLDMRNKSNKNTTTLDELPGAEMKHPHQPFFNFSSHFSLCCETAALVAIWQRWTVTLLDPLARLMSRSFLRAFISGVWIAFVRPTMCDERAAAWVLSKGFVDWLHFNLISNAQGDYQWYIYIYNIW